MKLNITNLLMLEMLEENLECSIIMELMNQAVITPDGHNYQEKAILQWLENHDSDPNTRHLLVQTDLVPNYWVRRIVSDLKSNKPVPLEQFSCPLTGKLLQDPVVAADGYTYEREAIQQFLQQHAKSPLTGKKINIALRDNRPAKQSIDVIKQKKPNYFLKLQIGKGTQKKPVTLTQLVAQQKWHEVVSKLENRSQLSTSEMAFLQPHRYQIRDTFIRQLTDNASSKIRLGSVLGLDAKPKNALGQLLAKPRHSRCYFFSLKRVEGIGKVTASMQMLYQHYQANNAVMEVAPSF